MNCLVLENLSKYNPSKIQEIANRLNSSSKDIMLVCPVDKNYIHLTILEIIFKCSQVRLPMKMY